MHCRKSKKFENKKELCIFKCKEETKVLNVSSFFDKPQKI